VKEKRLPSPVPNAIKCLPLPSTDVRKKAINFLLTGHVEQAYNVKNSGKRGTANDEEKKNVCLGYIRFLFQTQKMFTFVIFENVT
jgi:hypothetical protein